MAESLDAVSLYFRAIKDFPELTREAFNTLWYRANKGDKLAKTELVERNLRLVIPIAKKYYRYYKLTGESSNINPVTFVGAAWDDAT